MKKYFKYNLDEFKPLIGKVISGLYFVDDFRGYQSGFTCYHPYKDQFEGISNMIIWYYSGQTHETIKLYCINNGLFHYVDDNNNDQKSYYGVRSIKTISNDDLFFGKSGSIRLKNQSGFGIEGFGVIKKIKFFQEIHQNLNEYELNRLYPSLEEPNCFPDRIIIETENRYAVIRAEEDYDQNLLLKCKLGKMDSTDSYFESDYNDNEGIKYLFIDEIE